MAEHKEMKALLAKLVGQLEAIVPYADALYSEYSSKVLSKDTTGIEPRIEAHAGVKVRAFDGLQFHEVCIQGWQPQLLQSEVHSLIAKLKSRPITGKSLSLKMERDNL